MLSSTTFPTMADRLFPPDESVSPDTARLQDSQTSVESGRPESEQASNVASLSHLEESSGSHTDLYSQPAYCLPRIGRSVISTSTEQQHINSTNQAHTAIGFTTFAGPAESLGFPLSQMYQYTSVASGSSNMQLKNANKNSHDVDVISQTKSDQGSQLNNPDYRLLYSNSQPAAMSTNLGREYAQYSSQLPSDLGRDGGLFVLGSGSEKDLALTSDLADKYLSRADQLQGSMADTGTSRLTYSVLLEQDTERLDSVVNSWTSTLKKNILEELKHAKLHILEYHQRELAKEKDKCAAEVQILHKELEGQQELMRTYEKSLERKDEALANLTTVIQRHRDKLDVQRAFCEWRIKLVDIRREEFASKLARKHYERTLCQKTFALWKSHIESRWRERVEVACQRRAQQVCITLTNDYEARIASVNEALEASRAEVLRLQRAREKYEEEMKRAFMRGVCALNLEAMNVFSDDKDHVVASQSLEDAADDGRFAGGSGIDYLTASQQYTYHTNPSGVPTSVQSNSGQQSSRSNADSNLSSRQDASRSRSGGVSLSKGHYKVTGRVDSGLNQPPLPANSIVVEKHQPLPKGVSQVITAAHLVKPQQQRSGRTSASQASSTGSSAAAVKYQPIKVLQ